MKAIQTASSHRSTPIASDDPEELLRQLSTPEGVENPYPLYERLRRTAPVHRSSSAGGICFISSWEGANAMLRSRSFGNGPDAPIITAHPCYEHSEGFRRFADFMMFKDPPEHTRLKQAAMLGFAPTLTAQMKAAIQTQVDRTLEDLAHRDTFDGVTDFAAIAPLAIMASLLGIPEKDHPMIGGWIRTQALGLGPNMTQGLMARIDDSTLSLQAYLLDLARLRKASPGDDVVSRLVAASPEGAPLREDELVALLNVLLSAGVETTQNVLGTAIHNLLKNPTEMIRLRQSQAFDHICADEFIRFDGPAVISNVRFAFEDCTVSGVSIARGEPVIAILAAANRDPSVFDAPDRLDIGRRPNPHLGFAAGIHGCLGAGLARLEIAMAIPAFVRRFPGLRLTAAPTYAMGAGAFRTITSLPLSPA